MNETLHLFEMRKNCVGDIFLEKKPLMSLEIFLTVIHKIIRHVLKFSPALSTKMRSAARTQTVST